MSKKNFIISGLILAVFAVIGLGAIAQADSTLNASINGPSTIMVGETATFDVAVTGGSGFYSYVWNFGDGSQMAGLSVTHAYETAGAKTVTVVVTDTDSNQTSANLTLLVNEEDPALPLTAEISAPADNATFSLNQSITFDVAVTGGSGFYSYVWNFGDGSQMAGLSVTHAYETAGAKTVTVVVTDTDSNQTSAAVHLTIEEGSVTPAPAVTFTANGQTGSITVSTTTSVTLAWTTTNATTCSATNDWSGTKAVNDSESVGPFATAGITKTFTLTCTGAGGTTAKSVDVTTATDSNPDPDLVITNVRVTDITKTSAIVRWETNLAADSRVLYDTTSHPDISGQSAPNYGYQFSTGTDSALVTTHAVTVTGLSAGTHYYFRVISEN